MFLSVREASLFTGALLLAGLIGIHRLGFDEFASIRRGVLKVGDAPVVSRSMFVVFVDVAVVLVAAYVAVGVETDSWSLTATSPGAMDVASILAPLTVLVSWQAGVYSGNWRPAGAGDLVRLCGVPSSVALIGLVGSIVLELNRYPPSLFAVYGLVSLVLVTASRATYPRQSVKARPGLSAIDHALGSDAAGQHRLLFPSSAPEKSRSTVESDAA